MLSGSSLEYCNMVPIGTLILMLSTAAGLLVSAANNSATTTIAKATTVTTPAQTTQHYTPPPSANPIVNSISPATMTTAAPITSYMYASTSEGTSFVISFPPELSKSDKDPQLVICTSSPETVTVVLASQDPSVSYYWTTSIDKNDCETIDIPAVLRLTKTGYAPSNYLLVTSTYYPISVKVFLFGSCSGYAALPESSLGMLYYVTTLPPSTPYGRSFITITATIDSTTVNINLLNIQSSSTVTVNAYPYSFSQSNMASVIMNRGDALTLSCNVDLSGSIIDANKPIAVVAGNMNQSSNFIANQFQPASAWSNSYILPAGQSSPFSTYTVKVVTKHFASIVTMGSKNLSTNSTNFAMSSSQSGPMVINSSQPFQVVQYFNSMPGLQSLISSTNVFVNEYDFFIPSITLLAANQYYLMITIVTVNSTGLVLDNNPVNTTGWAVSGSYSTGFVDLSGGHVSGGHVLKHSSGAYFGVTLYSTDSQSCSFGFPLGMGPLVMLPITPVSTITPTVAPLNAFGIQAAYIVLIGMGGALILLVVIALIIICDYPLFEAGGAGSKRHERVEKKPKKEKKKKQKKEKKSKKSKHTEINMAAVAADNIDDNAVDSHNHHHHHHEKEHQNHEDFETTNSMTTLEVRQSDFMEEEAVDQVNYNTSVHGEMNQGYEETNGSYHNDEMLGEQAEHGF